jgi:hypothetical protein
MNKNKPTPEQLQALLQYASKKLGTTPEQLAQTVDSDAAKKLASKLSSVDSARFQEVVSDKDKLEKMLSSPQAQQLIERLMGGKK